MFVSADHGWDEFCLVTTKIAQIKHKKYEKNSGKRPSGKIFVDMSLSNWWPWKHIE